MIELDETREYSKFFTIDEVRKERYNADPIGDERGELLEKEIGQGTKADLESEDEDEQEMPPNFFGQQTVDEPAEETPAEIKANLATWRQLTIKDVKNGKPASPGKYLSMTIPRDIQLLVRSGLRKCTTTSEVREVFDQAFYALKSQNESLDLVQELKRANDMLERVKSG